jgi:ribonuclease HI
MMYFDGSLKLEGVSLGVLFISRKGEQLKYVLLIIWEVCNNEAEYGALLHGLRLAVFLGIKRLLVYIDSLLLINQVNKEWDHNKDTMDAYCMEVHKMENKFPGLKFHHVIRENNMGLTYYPSWIYSSPSTRKSIRAGAASSIHQTKQI